MLGVQVLSCARGRRVDLRRRQVAMAEQHLHDAGPRHCRSDVRQMHDGACATVFRRCPSSWRSADDAEIPDGSARRGGSEREIALSFQKDPPGPRELAHPTLGLFADRYGGFPVALAADPEDARFRLTGSEEVDQLGDADRRHTALGYGPVAVAQGSLMSGASSASTRLGQGLGRGRPIFASRSDRIFLDHPFPQQESETPARS